MTAKISTLSSKQIYENKWLSLREDAIQFPDGSKGIYSVVDKQDFALIVPLHADGRIQMVEQYRYPVSERLWEVPQGSWPGNTTATLADVAKGELAEETGLRAKSMLHLDYFRQAAGVLNQGYDAFLATDLVQGETQRDPEEQGMETEAFSLAEILEMIESGQVRDAPTIAALGLLRLRNLI